MSNTDNSPPSTATKTAVVKKTKGDMTGDELLKLVETIGSPMETAEEIRRLQQENTQLQQENTQLRTENSRLQEENADLRDG